MPDFCAFPLGRKQSRKLVVSPLDLFPPLLPSSFPPFSRLLPTMSSFFQRLHGATSSFVTAPPKVKQVPPQSRHKPSPETVSRTTTLTKTTVQTIKAVTAKPSADHTSSVRRSGNDTSVSRVEMRRSKSSTTDHAPVTKKRKTNPVKIIKNVSEHDVTRLSTLSPHVDLKRRRTASPAYRIHRTSSDDE